jgi:hypothetical protein
MAVTIQWRGAPFRSARRLAGLLNRGILKDHVRGNGTESGPSHITMSAQASHCQSRSVRWRGFSRGAVLQGRDLRGPRLPSTPCARPLPSIMGFAIRLVRRPVSRTTRKCYLSINIPLGCSSLIVLSDLRREDCGRSTNPIGAEYRDYSCILSPNDLVHLFAYTGHQRPWHQV